MAPSTMYERVGGDAFFETLTRRFYDGVRTDPDLAPLYPDDPADFEAARAHLQAFLVQFWGGPGTYSEQRGHPRLRMRHLPFVIGPAQRDAWVRHMSAAVRAAGLGALDEVQMLRYFDAAATQMVNAAPDVSGRPPRPGPAPALAADLVADVSGHGPAVVLLHGQPGSAGDWDAVVGALAGEVTTIVPDRPGYGRTGGRAGGFGANAAAVERLLDEQGVDRAVLVGHSWGGGVAITLAGTRPDRVAGLVLVASVGPDEPVTPVDRILATWPVGDLVAAVALGGTGRLLTVPAVRRHLLPRLPDPARTVLASLRRPAGTAHLWRSFADEQRSWLGEAAGLTAALAGVSAPVTVVTGTADHVVDPAVAARLAAAVDGAVLVEVPGVGHLLPFDAPGAVADAVRATARRAGLS